MSVRLICIAALPVVTACAPAEPGPALFDDFEGETGFLSGERSTARTA